ncbi:MAG: hypothetical protein ACJAV5_000829 [Vicingaceae bacterium]|jgi:hypothetical protein
MKKEHILLSSFLLCSILGFTQNKIKQKTTIPQIEAALTSSHKTIDPDFLKAAKFNSKAFGDTLFYDDFDSSRWSVINNSPNPFQWRWTTTFLPGPFSTANNIITSTTASNGFMLLNSGLFNTPIPPTGPVAMDTYFQSDSIDLTKGGNTPGGFCSVWVSYQQTLRYCCSGANRLVLQVSSDNFITFQEYDATNSLAVNAASGTFTNIINISTAAAFTPNIKVRLLSEGNSHYYWMIDDFAIIEGANNVLELRTPYVEFNSDYVYNPFYGQIPYGLMTPLPLSGFVYNSGCNDLTGVKIEGDIVHTADLIGNPGTGLVYSTSSTPANLVSNIRRDTADYKITNGPRFVPTVLGKFRVDMIATSDSVNQNPANATHSQLFSTSDTILARDDNGYGGGTGPGSYVRNNQPGGTIVGDRFGTMYVVESRTGNGGNTKVPTSITFAVSNDPTNIGVEIVPKIWSYVEDSLFAPASGTIAAAFSGGEVASSFIPYTILSADTNTLLTLPLDNGPAVFNGLDSGQYVVGWEVTNTNGGNSFEVQVDASSGQFQDNVTCFVDLAHQPGWGWVDVNPVIRLNMGNLPIPTSLKNEVDSNTTVSIQPNPSNGEFSLTFETTERSTFQLNVRNSLGQLFYSETINIQGANTKRFDFSKLDKGIYFISLQNESENIVETVVIH